jgi:pimeloyl-ACP methyl ester carboxylesterase
MLLMGIMAFATLPASPRGVQDVARGPRPPTVQFITVDSNVTLEVLDWGGVGRPLVLLAGIGGTAHTFDSFAPKLTATYHVYGITRRGFGASSAPAPTDGNYDADRLGDDVLAVVDSLKLDRPVLVGHSLAGEELSSIGTRHPEKVAGLIYLDAGYSYAYYDRSQGDLLIDWDDLKKTVDRGMQATPAEQKRVVRALLRTKLPQFERDLRSAQTRLDKVPDSRPVPTGPETSVVGRAIMAGLTKYTDIRCPVLAIFAVPHDLGAAYRNDPAARTWAETSDLAMTTADANTFERGVPSARVVRLPHADHFIFVSNEADVLREMNAFFGTLH